MITNPCDNCELSRDEIVEHYAQRILDSQIIKHKLVNQFIENNKEKWRVYISESHLSVFDSNHVAINNLYKKKCVEYNKRNKP